MNSELHSDKPLAISLQKKTFLKDRNGIFNRSAAALSHMRTVRKYRSQGNWKDFKAGARAQKHRSHASHFTSPWKRQAERLTDQGNQMWTGLLQIGTPAQTFSVDFDTGSADFWIPSSDCVLRACASKNSYRAFASSTSSMQTSTFNITYGDGSSTAGYEYRDAVKLAGITINNQTFASASILSVALGNDPTDGVMGLAYPSISHLKSSSFIENAFNQGLIPSKSFSFKLSNEGSELFLGGVDHSKFSGELEFHPVIRQAYWEIGGGSIYVNNQNIEQQLQGGYRAIFDTGTTIMYGPAAAVESIYSSVNGSSRYEEVEGLWKFPCLNAPLVSFSWNGGKRWEVKVPKLSLGQLEEKATECIGAISSQNLGLGIDTWLLGDSFMTNVYSSFDPTKNTVSFAKPA